MPLKESTKQIFIYDTNYIDAVKNVTKNSTKLSSIAESQMPTRVGSARFRESAAFDEDSEIKPLSAIPVPQAQTDRQPTYFSSHQGSSYEQQLSQYVQVMQEQ